MKPDFPAGMVLMTTVTTCRTKPKSKTSTVAQFTSLVLDNFDRISTSLDFEYDEYDNRLTMCCPIHDGDNSSACVIFKDGESISGNWSCFTHGCEQQYGISIIGFIRGILERKTGKEKTYGDVIKYVEDVLSRKVSDVVVHKNINDEYRSFVDYNNRAPAIQLPKTQLEKSLKIPSQYYIRRGYSREVLIKYSVGFCNTPGKPFYLRTVVPVFDDTMRYAEGFTARTINKECPDCGWYHYEKYSCPQTQIEKYFASKWVNSKGFSKTQYLYNSWYAKEFIKESQTAILVEGPGDVWRLEECGIHNGLSIFGCKLNSKQVAQLHAMGAKRLIVVLDNDPPGLIGKEFIRKKYSNDFELHLIDLQNKDIGDTPHAEVRKLFNEYSSYLR